MMLLFVLVYFFQPFQHEINLNAYNFLKNGVIFNLLALLDLSQSPLCISIISFDDFDMAFNYYVFILCISI